MANRTQLQAALQKPYDKILFTKEVLIPVFSSYLKLYSSPVPASVQPNQSEQAVIQSVSIYGTICLEDGTEINCYEINLQPSVRIEYCKVAIQRYVRKLLTAGQIALVNFITPQNKQVWRLTLVAKDSELTEQGIKEKITHAKRYTYLLGPSETCKTAAERFESLSIEKPITFQTLVNAFSVEKLSKAFFDEYTLHYQKFCDYLQESNFRKSVFNISIPENASKEEKNKACKPIRDFVKKLLGRIVFLYFVQKKGWLGASDTHYKDGLADFITKLFTQSGGNDTFYPNWLTVLFFETLNKERSNDGFTMPNGKTVKVPFLNGGLFDKEAYDEAVLTIPAKLFHHPDFEDTPLSDKNKDHARGFLNFLDAFNFTVYEDGPDDHTVAVDPEMLGHIFENLLEDNKDKGAFYTPKEIVHYMCQESLIEYLTAHLSKEYTVYKEIDNAQVELFGNETKTGQLKMVEQLGDKALKRDDVENIVKHKDISHLTKTQLKKIDVLLDTVKICDPAIGSGAFPMGLLQEIHAIKELIAYELQLPWNPAEVKENIIQNSIYGVDIEKGAVDIARLRFWLSLVVDEEKHRALPNLDYKIVVGDSLVSRFEGEIIEIDWERKSSVGKADTFVQNIQRLLKEIAEKQKKFFKPDNKDKKKLQAEIRNLKLELLINQLSFNKEKFLASNVEKGGFAPTDSDLRYNEKLMQKKREFDNHIAKLQKLKQNKDEPFEHFDWKLDFPEVLNPYLVNGNAGFDIVIGNPPYIQLQKDGGKLAREYEKLNFETFERTGDIYSLFYEKGIYLLKSGGHLCYITSNKWMRAGYGKSTRSFFIKNNPLKLMDLGSGIFKSATVDTNILIIQKSENQHQLQAADLSKAQNVHNLINPSYVTLKNLTADSWIISSDIEQRIKAKIEAKGKPLKEWDIQINYGIKTGYNEAFIIDGKKRNELIAQDPKSAEIIKPLLRGRDIKRYKAEWQDLWLINSHNGVKELGIPRIDVPKDYPAIYQHLLQFENKLKKRQDKGDHWTNLRNCAYIQEFEKEKIVYSEIVRSPQFYYDKNNYTPEATVFFMTGVSLKYLTGVLNSKPNFWIFKNFFAGAGLGEEGIRYKKQFLVELPIPEIPATQQRPIVELVEQIIAQKEKGEDTTVLEQQIDNMVYKLYDLTYEEVKVMDPQFPLSQEEYESLSLA